MNNFEILKRLIIMELIENPTNAKKDVLFIQIIFDTTKGKR